MGELHLEVIKHRLLRDFKLNVRVHKPRVSYRETVQKSVEVTGECTQAVAGQTLFAKVRHPDRAGRQRSSRSRSFSRPASQCRPSFSRPCWKCSRNKGKGADRWASR